MVTILFRICYLLAMLLCGVVFAVVVLFSPIEFLLTGHSVWCDRILDTAEEISEKIKTKMK